MPNLLFFLPKKGQLRLKPKNKDVLQVWTGWRWRDRHIFTYRAASTDINIGDTTHMENLENDARRKDDR